MMFYILWATGILAIIALFTFAKPSWSQFRSFEKLEIGFSKWPIDLRVILILIMAFISFGFNGCSRNYDST